MGVSTVIPGWFLKMFWGCFKGVLQMFQGCFKSISRVFYGCFKENLSAIKGCFKHVSSVLLMCISVGLYNSVFEIFRWRKRTRIIATLSSILDSQLSWESGKFKHARWSHNVALFSKNHPTHSLRNRPTQHIDSATDPQPIIFLTST